MHIVRLATNVYSAVPMSRSRRSYHLGLSGLRPIQFSRLTCITIVPIMWGVAGVSAWCSLIHSVARMGNNLDLVQCRVAPAHRSEGSECLS